MGTLGLLVFKPPVEDAGCGGLWCLKTREDGGGEGAESSSWVASCITCTGIDVAVMVVSLLLFGIDVAFVEAREGGIIDNGERGIESGTGLVGLEGLEDNDVDADDDVDETSISDGFFLVSSWNNPPAMNFFPP